MQWAKMGQSRCQRRCLIGLNWKRFGIELWLFRDSSALCNDLLLSCVFNFVNTQRTSKQANPATVKAAFDAKVKAAAMARAAKRELDQATDQDRESLARQKDEADKIYEAAANAAAQTKRQAVEAAAVAKRHAKMQLTTVDLTGNAIGDLGAEAILEVMSTHNTITVGAPL